ncbi:hypothetical protein STRIC_1370 [Streptococcus ictaluri 707-05]|uniref:Uncharacterized protein n=1 Tax=Streptococcus ictaluri 707-05 TaxID=764299 RepID=G5K3K0_9STRE|nr:hypothetical protein STRIC_1370 [Streptococcus ictaluri 707-05]
MHNYQNYKKKYPKKIEKRASGLKLILVFFSEKKSNKGSYFKVSLSGLKKVKK